MATSLRGATSALQKHESHRDELIQRIPVIKAEIERLGSLLARKSLGKAEKTKAETQLRHQKKTLGEVEACVAKEEAIILHYQEEKAMAERREKSLAVCYSELLVRSGMKSETVEAMPQAKRRTLARMKVPGCIHWATGGAANPKGNRDSLVLDCVGHMRANEFLAKYYAPKLTLKMHLQFKKELVERVKEAMSAEALNEEKLREFLKEATVKDEELRAAKRRLRSTPSSKKTHALNNKTHWVRY